MAVIEDHRQNRQAAQPVEFGQIGGKPGWALDGQGKQLAGQLVSELLELMRAFR